MEHTTEHRARKRFGQNFLKDRNVIEKIIHCIAPQRPDRFVEIGPGLGALTCPMLEHVDRLDVIELDRDVIPLLERNCGNNPALTIHESDVLKFDFDRLAADEGLRIIGNLPYNISTPVLFHLLESDRLIRDMHFMLQKEVVDRICAGPGNKDYGRLSVMMQTWFETESLFEVSPNCFSPPPKVQSAIIRLVPSEHYKHDVIDANEFSALVRQAFSQRRKTLRNTLKPLCNAEQISAAGIDPGARAETLDISEFLRLHRHLADNGHSSSK